jgi:predicted RNase H-like nuclease
MSVTVVVIGIDLAWGERSGDGFAEVRFDQGIGAPPTGTRLATFRGDGALFAAIEEAVAQAVGCIIALDAPLICPNAEGSRPVDRECSRLFHRQHAGCHPANSRRCVRPLRIAEGLRKRGFNIAGAIDGSHLMACEVYPHPATIRLFGIDRIVKYKRGPIASRRLEFARLQAMLRGSLERELPGFAERTEVAALLGQKWSKPVEDQTDALICALIGYLHLRHKGRRSEVLGNDETGHIVVPTSPQREREA